MKKVLAIVFTLMLILSIGLTVSAIDRTDVALSLKNANPSKKAETASGYSITLEKSAAKVTDSQYLVDVTLLLQSKKVTAPKEQATASNPKTGDTNRYALPVTLLVTSSLGLFFLLVGKKGAKRTLMFVLTFLLLLPIMSQPLFAATPPVYITTEAFTEDLLACFSFKEVIYKTPGTEVEQLALDGKVIRLVWTGIDTEEQQKLVYRLELKANVTDSYVDGVTDIVISNSTLAFTDPSGNNKDISYPTSPMINLDEIIRYVEVNYDPNGGVGSVITSSPFVRGTSHTVQANTFTNDGYRFDRWNTAANGSGTDYYPSDSISEVIGNTTLYAVWVKVYKVTYHPNFTPTTIIPVVFEVDEGDVHEILRGTVDLGFMRPWMNFESWNTEEYYINGTDYPPGSNITITADITLYAVWYGEN